MKTGLFCFYMVMMLFAFRHADEFLAILNDYFRKVIFDDASVFHVLKCVDKRGALSSEHSAEILLAERNLNVGAVGVGN